MKRCFFFFLFTVVLAGCISSRSTVSDPIESEKIAIAASFYPLAFLAEKIGGDMVAVTQITPGGVEPHEYEPSPKQLAALHDAKIFLMNGAGIDEWAEKLRKNESQIIINMIEHLLPLFESMTNDGNTQVDPHIWLSPVLMKKEAELIRDALLTVDPKSAAFYNANAKKLLSELSDLDKSYRDELRACKLRQIVVSHNAFRYLAKEYGFETIAIAGLSPDEEPSSLKIAEIADFAQANNIQHIFFESLVSPKLSETIAREIGAVSLVLNPVEGLTPEDSAQGKDYISVMRENLTNLRTALQCQ